MNKKEVSNKEQKLINQERIRLLSQRSKANRFLIVWTIFIWVVAFLVWYFNYPELQSAMIFCSVTFPLIGLWVYIQEIRRINKRLNSINFLINSNNLSSLRIKSNRFYHIIEEKDEGDYYLFELEGNKIISIGGQEFYPTKRFPNSDFEIVEGRGMDNELVLFTINCYGEKIKPVKEIVGKDKTNLLSSSHYPNPEKYEVISGKLEEVEEIIKEKTAHNN